jgi:hypothetical protein
MGCGGCDVVTVPVCTCVHVWAGWESPALVTGLGEGLDLKLCVRGRPMCTLPFTLFPAQWQCGLWPGLLPFGPQLLHLLTGSAWLEAPEVTFPTSWPTMPWHCAQEEPGGVD